MSRALRPFLASAAAVLALTFAASTVDAASKTPQERRREVQRRKAEAARELDGLKATEAELERALDALDAGVRAEQARVAAAESAARAAAARAAAARSRQAEIQLKLDHVQATVRNAAVRAYINGGADDFAAGLDAASLGEMATKRQMLKMATGEIGDAADELQAARRDLDDERQAAERAETEAKAREAEVSAGLQQVEQARNAKRRLADQAEDRLERALAESASLEAIDRQLAADIAARQRRIAAKVGTDTSRRGPVRRVGNVQVTTVRGITVATSIADQLERLLAAAEADGFVFGGGGYRDSSAQVATRRANCGTSDYDVYEKPASQCRPPTARPGQSMHEQGLAVDFTVNGRTIRSRSDPGFRWLQANAGRYGFKNLPSEPWHWSTNGN